MSSLPPGDVFAPFASLPVPMGVVRGELLVFANRALHALLALPEGQTLVGRPLRALLEQHLRAEDQAGVHAPARPPGEPAAGEAFCYQVLRDASGRARPVSSWRIPGPGPDEVTYVLERTDGEAAAQALSSALAGATARILGLREEQAVLECAVDAVHQQGLYAVALRLEGGCVAYAAVRERPAFYRTCEEVFGVPVTQVRVPRSVYPQLEALLQTRRAVFFEDMHALAADNHGEAASEALAAHGATPLRGMAAPLFVEGEPWGYLTVQGELLTPAGAAALELFAQGVGAALENARHHARARAQLRELERLQGELVRQAQVTVLGEAAAVVAHEVRNPLAVILNAVSLLRRETQLSALGVQMVHTVEEEASQLAALVKDLLHVSLPMEPQRTSQDVGLLVQRTVERLGLSAEAVRVEVGGPALVEADGHLLQLALEKLLRNALEASPPGEPVRVQVSCNEDGDGVTVAMEDRGPGIPLQERSRIFEPFFTTRSGGHGLGLTLVKRVADVHGGRVAVEEREGGGIRFTLHVPPR